MRHFKAATLAVILAFSALGSAELEAEMTPQVGQEVVAAAAVDLMGIDLAVVRFMEQSFGGTSIAAEPLIPTLRPLLPGRVLEARWAGQHMTRKSGSTYLHPTRLLHLTE